MAKECKEYPGFYHIPNNERFVINRESRVIDTDIHCCMVQYLNAGYPYCPSVGFTHRALAMTFLPDPDVPTDTLDVNHIDGVRLNNDLSNLEWVTRSRNCLHAYQNDLREDNTPILVKDLRDSTCKRYYSLQECAREFGIGGSRVHQFLQPYNYGKVTLCFYVFIREGQDWPPTTKEDIGLHRNGTAKAVLARNVESGESKMFASRGAAAQHFGFNQATVGYHLNKKDSSSYNGWIFQYTDDPELIRVAMGFTKSPNIGGARRKPTPVKITDPDGNVKEWLSVEEFGKGFGVPKNTIQASINRKGHWKGYQVTYL